MATDPKTRYLPRHRWYLADAQLLVRKLQAIAWPNGWHIALGGGVLNHGYSDKDLDLYALPIYNQPGTADEDHLLCLMHKTLEGAEMSRVCSLQDNPHECYQYATRFSTRDDRDVELFIVKRSWANAITR